MSAPDDLISGTEAARFCRVSARRFRTLRHELTAYPTASGDCYSRAEVLRFAAERPSRPRRNAAPAPVAPLPKTLAPTTDPALPSTLIELGISPELAAAAATWPPARVRRLESVARDRNAAFAEFATQRARARGPSPTSGRIVTDHE